MAKSKKENGDIYAITNNKHLEIKCYERNQVDDKIEWGLGGGFLSIHLNFVC